MRVAVVVGPAVGPVTGTGGSAPDVTRTTGSVASLPCCTGGWRNTTDDPSATAANPLPASARSSACCRLMPPLMAGAFLPAVSSAFAVNCTPAWAAIRVSAVESGPAGISKR